MDAWSIQVQSNHSPVEWSSLSNSDIPQHHHLNCLRRSEIVGSIFGVLTNPGGQRILVERIVQSHRQRRARGADAAFTKPAKGGATPDLSPIDLIQYWHFYRQ